MATAWNGLLDDRGKIGASTSPLACNTEPSLSTITTEPKWLLSWNPDRITLTSSTGVRRAFVVISQSSVRWKVPAGSGGRCKVRSDPVAFGSRVDPVAGGRRFWPGRWLGQPVRHGP